MTSALPAIARGLREGERELMEREGDKMRERGRIGAMNVE